MPCCMHGVTRRRVLAGLSSLPLVSAVAPGAAPTVGQRLPLRVQPVLIYDLAKRKPQTSWRGWGGLFTEKEVGEEKSRIQGELASITKSAGYPIEFLPLREATNVEQAKEVASTEYDAVLLYPAAGSGKVLETLARPDRPTVIFIRHRSGPVYLWYEIIHPRFLRKTVDEWGQPGVDAGDVVVDDLGDVAWRLRALGGLKSTMGRRILCLGGASGWGVGGRRAPQMARDVFKMDLVETSYDELGRRLREARISDTAMKTARQLAGAYLSSGGMRLETDRGFVDNAFLLTDVLRKMMREAGATAFTINNCMSTVMKVGETTACLPLSLLNDEGYLAFCESDFVVIPSGILLQSIAGTPVFLNDPTTPHHGLVTLAHCTAPRKMDGRNAEPVRMVTHFESDYGAAPKVEMRIGQRLTNIVPDFSFKKWVGFEGEVAGNPFLPICRSQIDVGIKGSDELLAREMRGFHWMTCYGDYLKETGYALKKVGIDWLNITAPRV
ncbi:MAG: sugar isomerase [Acidobacteria bacterium]|nr:sugar isomerase [Acidobacteriota bacterium]